jgi:PPOX class probable F420-dependent enzyme
MIPDEVRALFDGANTAHVATLMADGAPHSVPVWVGLDGDRVTFLSSLDSVKGRNVQRDPRVSISITHADAPNTMAQVRGRVNRILEDDRGWELIDGLAQKYIGVPYPLRTDRALFLVDVERAWAQSF